MVKRAIHKTIVSYACPVYSDRSTRNPEARENIQLVINDALFLEILLMNIRSDTIAYSIKKVRESRANENRLLKELQVLEALSIP